MFYYSVRGWHNPRENITFIMEKNLSHLLPVLLNNFFLFLFFLLNLFGPLNGIQQLEDISDTRLSGFFHLPFCALRAQFLCDTALPSWRFWLGTLDLTAGSLRPEIGGYTVPATSIHPILNPFEQPV